MMIRPQICIPLVVLALISVLWSFSSTSQTQAQAKQAKIQSAIIFSHTLHVGENEIECETCHTDIRGSKLAADKNLPLMETCGDCHEVEEDDNCGQCHIDPDDPLELENPVREIMFNHESHLAQELDCMLCHSTIVDPKTAKMEHLPGMGVCLDCHDGDRAADDCALCHGENITLAEIHPPGWRRQHGDRASFDRDKCLVCHQQEESCLDCHRGDNLQGKFHEFNFLFNHGLDALSKETDCAKCHDRRSFCNDCHESENRIPLLHSSQSWRMEHGKAARRDIEDCASCHDSDDPTCARSGCHSDFDGVRGTNPRIHRTQLDMTDVGGAWHDDGGYFCYQCHTNTNKSGTGFCGYCHK